MAIDGWRQLKIDELKAEGPGAISIGPFGSRMKSDCYVPTGVPVIRGNNISSTHEFVGDFVFITQQKADELRSSNVFPDDLVFPHRGAIGEVGIVPRNRLRRYVLSSSLMKLTCNKSLVDPVFLFHFFRSEMGRHELLKNASTVGTPGIGQPLTSLRSIIVPIPPLAEQRAIANILGVLDDKIELNRRMNETLESLARAIFQSWFVDFDPVRAKRDGMAPPGLTSEIAAHFPDSFEFNKGELIPTGWNIAAVTDVYEIRSGLSKPRAEFGFGHGFLTFLNVLNNTFVPHRLTSLVNSTATEQSQCSVRRGDVFLTRTSETQEELGMSCVSLDDYPNATFNGFTKRLRPKEASYLSPEYAGFYFRSPKVRREITAMSSLSTRASLNNEMLAKLSILLPPKPIGDIFTSHVSSAIKRIQSNKCESETLSAIRDALLPKLLSGEIRVADAERLVEDAL